MFLLECMPFNSQNSNIACLYSNSRVTQCLIAAKIGFCIGLVYVLKVNDTVEYFNASSAFKANGAVLY